MFSKYPRLLIFCIFFFIMLFTAACSPGQHKDSSGDENITVNEEITLEQVKNGTVYYNTVSPLGYELECYYVKQIDGNSGYDGYGRSLGSCWRTD